MPPKAARAKGRPEGVDAPINQSRGAHHRRLVKAVQDAAGMVMSAQTKHGGDDRGEELRKRSEFVDQHVGELVRRLSGP